jgi:ATP-dependent DNA helicase RecQ
VINGWTQQENVQPVAIVGMSSRQRSRLLHSLTAGISQKGGLPLLGALQPASGAPRAGQVNSARRVAALHADFGVHAPLAEACVQVTGPVLLVDDFVDSGWTMTLAARALRRAAAINVLPFALAITGRRD